MWRGIHCLAKTWWAIFFDKCEFEVYVSFLPYRNFLLILEVLRNLSNVLLDVLSFCKKIISPLSYCWDEECRQALCWYMCSRCKLWRCRSWGMRSQIRNVIHIFAKNWAAPHQPNWQNIQALQNEEKNIIKLGLLTIFVTQWRFLLCIKPYVKCPPFRWKLIAVSLLA